MTLTQTMLTLKGTGNKRGCAVGKTEYLPREDYLATSPAGDPRRELLRLENAIKKSKEELLELYRSLSLELGEPEAWVFLMQIYLLDGSLFSDTPRFYIAEGKSADEAIRLSHERHTKSLGSAPYISPISEDIRDVMLRVRRHLCSSGAPHPQKESFILFTPSPTPSQIYELNGALIGVVAGKGWESTSAASLARALFIPTVTTEAGLDEAHANKNAIIDSGGGCVYVDPDLETLEGFAAKQDEKSSFDGTPGKRRLPVLAEPQSLLDASRIHESDLDGVGLFHSEELYLKSVAPPDEELLFETYRTLTEALLPRPLVIRTFSVSGSVRINKMTTEGKDEPELYVFHDEILTRQLRAALRAAVFGTVALAVPCGLTYSVLKRTRELVVSLSDELHRENREHRTLCVGAVIDSPAAAIACDKVIDIADFIILGLDSLDLGKDMGEVALDAERYLLERVARTAKRKKKPALLSLGKSAEADTLSLAKKLGFSALVVPPDIADRFY